MTKNTYKYSFVFLLMVLIFSCSKETDPESLFEGSPTQRLSEETEELSNLLQSSPEGWKMTYFTDDPRYAGSGQQLGGWSFIFKFTSDKKVTMVSDYSDQTLVPQESEYQIQLGSTIKLVFVTKNYIHLLADAANYPTSALEGKGYLGDFEFLYYGEDGEDLIFKTNRAHIKIRFEKATAEDWNKLDDARANLDYLSSNLLLQINQGGETKSYKMSYDQEARYAENSVVDSLSFGIAPTPTGITILPPIPVGDQFATNFTYDVNNEWFIASLEGGASVTISVLPSVYLFETEGAFTTQNISWLISESSPDFITNIWNPVSSNVASIGYTFSGIFIGTDNIQYLLTGPTGGQIRVVHFITYELDVENNRIILSDNGWQNPGNQSVVEPLVQPLEDMLLDPEGLTIEGRGSLRGYPAFSIASYANPTIEIFTLGGF